MRLKNLPDTSIITSSLQPILGIIYMKTDARFPRLHIVDHPLIQHKLTIMRQLSLIHISEPTRPY